MTTPFVTWEGTYALGMVEIDEQHRTLFENHEQDVASHCAQ